MKLFTRCGISPDVTGNNILHRERFYIQNNESSIFKHIVKDFITAPSIIDFEQVNVSWDCSKLLYDAMISACDVLKVLAHFKYCNYSLLYILKA